jgi:hypothetical protein
MHAAVITAAGATVGVCCTLTELLPVLCSTAACSAAAAESASDRLGPQLLQHIRLPTWHTLLPPPAAADTTAAAASDWCTLDEFAASSAVSAAVDVGSHQPGPDCLWWCSKGSSSSTCQHSSQQWSEAIDAAAAAACATHEDAGVSRRFSNDTPGSNSTSRSDGKEAALHPLCDYCGCPAAAAVTTAHSRSRHDQQQQQDAVLQCCSSCGVARWCSRCASQHSSSHTAEACRWATSSPDGT